MIDSLVTWMISCSMDMQINKIKIREHKNKTNFKSLRAIFCYFKWNLFAYLQVFVLSLKPDTILILDRYILLLHAFTVIDYKNKSIEYIHLRKPFGMEQKSSQLDIASQSITSDLFSIPRTFLLMWRLHATLKSFLNLYLVYICPRISYLSCIYFLKES